MKLPFCWIYPLLKGLGTTLWIGLLNVIKRLDSLMLRDLYYTEIEYERRGTCVHLLSSFILFEEKNYVKPFFCKLSNIPYKIKI